MQLWLLLLCPFVDLALGCLALELLPFVALALVCLAHEVLLVRSCPWLASLAIVGLALLGLSPVAVYVAYQAAGSCAASSQKQSRVHDSSCTHVCMIMQGSRQYLW